MWYGNMVFKYCDDDDDDDDMTHRLQYNVFKFLVPNIEKNMFHHIKEYRTGCDATTWIELTV